MYLKTKEFDREKMARVLTEEWNSEWDEEYGVVEEWIETGNKILNDLPQFMDETFPNWEYVGAEEFLYENLQTSQDIYFKGYIDAIIKCDGKGRNSGKKVYWIIDWKTATRSWHPQKRRDFNVLMQIMLYKTFWSRRHNIDMKDIKAGFALLKRQAKDGKRCELFEVSVGPKSSERSEKYVHNMVRTVKNKRYLKNKYNCKWCQYKGTKYCT
jgi:hypothetical protein